MTKQIDFMDNLQSIAIRTDVVRSIQISGSIEREQAGAGRRGAAAVQS